MTRLARLALGLAPLLAPPALAAPDDPPPAAAPADASTPTAPADASTPTAPAAAAAAAATAPPAAAADAPASPAADPPAEPTPDRIDLAAFAAAADAFTREAADYQSDLTRVRDHRAAGRRQTIERHHAAALDRLADEERRRRDAAITEFEAFLARYPEDARYTPDTLFRLAELHFEQQTDRYLRALDAYDRNLADHEAGRLAEAPLEPERDYGRTIELLDRLITTWPDARGIDGAHYLIGYCLAETGRGEQALQAFTTLVERYPDSRFAAETWTRIGEHHFEAGDLDAALAAYERVLGYKDSPYYDKALYKLAWTHYRLDRYPQAIDRFRELVEFSDDQVARTGKGESALRDEAIEYLAASIQEEDWDSDGEPDADAGLPRVLAHVTGERPYDAELLRAIVDSLHANTKYDDAVAVARHLLDRFPLDPQNPAVHARLIAAQERLQKTADAFAERDRLAALYGQGTPWHRANQDDPDALAAAARLMEQAILEAATWHHARAQALRPEGEAGDAAAADEARGEYALAAVGYQNYLAQYPDAQNAYQIGWFAADALFYAGRYADAAAAYAAVRDDDRGTEYTEPAAFSAILAREQEVRRLIADGRLDPRPSLLDAPPAPPEAPAAGAEPEDDGALRVIQPEAIPPPVAELIAAREAWLDRGLTNEAEPERGAVIAYKAGETWFDYRHHDNARKWFAWVLQRHPNSELARIAAANIIDTFRQTNDWQKMAEWAEIIADAGLGRDFDAEIDTLKVGALFKAAERLFADEQYEEAAAEYIRLVAENPDNRYADAALNNAAVAYEKTRRFESATRTYERIYRDYPQSAYAEKALYRVGVNAERFYDFDRAIATHLRLVDDYPDSESRADALYRAALLLERTRRYREAAAAYERYAALFPDREDTAETFFRAARVYQKLDDTPGQIRIYDTFVRRYGEDPANNARVVEGLAAIAAIHEAAGRTRDARAAWQRVIDEFTRRAMTPGTYEAQHPARARFELVEDDFERYRALRLEGSLRAQRATLTEMQNQVKALTAAYAEVLPYKSFEWTLATLYRLGHIYQLLAEALYNAPMPAGLSDDEVDVYRTQLEDIALVIEDEAVKRYEQAFEKARELRVTNAWTRRILQSLNKYKPGDYPLFKEERRVVAERLLTPPRLLAGSEAPPAPPAPAPAAPAPPGDEK